MFTNTKEHADHDSHSNNKLCGQRQFNDHQTNGGAAMRKKKQQRQIPGSM